MPYASFAAACRTPWRVVVPLKGPPPHGDLSRASYFIQIQSQRPRIYAEDQCPRIQCRPPIVLRCSKCDTYPFSAGNAMRTIYGLMRSFNSKRFSFHRARDRQIAQARGRRTSARQAPHGSRPALMSCAIEPACFVSGDSPALIFFTRYIGSNSSRIPRTSATRTHSAAMSSMSARISGTS